MPETGTGGIPPGKRKREFPSVSLKGNSKNKSKATDYP